MSQSETIDLDAAQEIQDDRRALSGTYGVYTAPSVHAIVDNNRGVTLVGASPVISEGDDGLNASLFSGSLFSDSDTEEYSQSTATAYGLEEHGRDPGPVNSYESTATPEPAQSPKGKEAEVEEDSTGHVRPGTGRQTAVFPISAARSFTGRVNAKKFFVTWPNLTEGEGPTIKEVADAVNRFKEVEWIIVSREIHAVSGKPHYHAVFQFCEPLRTVGTAWIEAFCGDRHGNVQVVRNVLAVIKYVIKDGDFVAIGIKPEAYIKARKRKRGSRFVSVVDSLVKGKSLYELNEEYPDVLARNLVQLQRWGAWVSANKPLHRVAGWKLRCVVLWGPTATGKSTIAHLWSERLGGGVYSVAAPIGGGRLWFTGYEGQRTLLLDDINLKGVGIRSMNKILDRFPLQLFVHGGVVNADYDTVIILDQHPFEAKWPKASHQERSALRRRYRSYYIKDKNTLWDTTKETWEATVGCVACLYDKKEMFAPGYHGGETPETGGASSANLWGQ